MLIEITSEYPELNIIPIKIIPCPTIREADGLAMSSRNVRLTEAERAQAPALYAIMQRAAAAIRAGGGIEAALETARAEVLAAGFREIEYLDLREAETLAQVTDLAKPVRLLAAVWLGDVRLIDNIDV